mmetsp:Transcript_5006/g.7550  ORF Transcript_5006/g.7550 Transcript_5006/m.7550 type:complete len:182 (+) Transcript_5006:1031-1576(+)
MEVGLPILLWSVWRKKVFDAHMKTPNQVDLQPGLIGQIITESDLLKLPDVRYGDAITGSALAKGVVIVLAYTEAWLRGIGCIPLSNHMEDAATAEISRVQIWQWRYHGVKTQDDGLPVTESRIRALVQEEVARNLFKGGKWRLAGRLVEDMLTKEKLDDFLTTVCYPHIVTIDDVSPVSRL